MSILLTVAGLATAVVFVFLGGWAIRESGKVRGPHYRRLLFGIGLAAVFHAAVGVFVAIFGFVHMEAGFTDSMVVAAWYSMGLLTGSGALGWFAYRTTTTISRPLQKAERLMGVMTDQLPERSVADLGLTAREIEVVKVISSGEMSDAGIADRLFISKATAATHVRNILRKAELSNRRDLMLLSGWKDLPASPPDMTPGPTPLSP